MIENDKIWQAVPHVFDAAMTLQSETNDFALGSVDYVADLVSGGLLADPAWDQGDGTALHQPLGGWWRQGVGTLCLSGQGRIDLSATDDAVLLVSQGNNTDLIAIEYDGTGQVRAIVITAGIVVADLVVGTVADNQDYAIAFAFQPHDFSAVLNGGPPITAASGLIPIVSEARIGRPGATDISDGGIQKIQYFPSRVSNSQLQVLTSL